jgi:hypothetical protein
VPNFLPMILGTLAVVSVVGANVLAYAAKFAIRRKGYPVSWVNFPGMHNDLANLREIIANASSPEEQRTYRRWLLCFYLQYAVFGLALAIFLGIWLCVVLQS